MFRRLLFAVATLAAAGLVGRAHATIAEIETATARVDAAIVLGLDTPVPWRQRLPLLLEMETVEGRLVEPRAKLPPLPLPAPRPIAHSATVLFGFDAAEITPAGQLALDRFFAALDNMIFRASADERIDPDVIELVITGYADRAGPDGYNLALSRQRAEAVVAALRRMGLTIESVSDLYVEAKGERELARATADGVPARANRRAVITALTYDNRAMRLHRAAALAPGGWSLVVRVSLTADR